MEIVLPNGPAEVRSLPMPGHVGRRYACEAAGSPPAQLNSIRPTGRRRSGGVG
jgi:hypothetical protein